MANERYTESDAFEDADAALRAALGLYVVLSANIGEPALLLATAVMDDISEGQRLLLNHARRRLDDLRNELWNAEARLGKYGPEKKAKAIKDHASEGEAA